jgi:hypothetical protein
LQNDWTYSTAKTVIERMYRKVFDPAQSHGSMYVVNGTGPSHGALAGFFADHILDVDSIPAAMFARASTSTTKNWPNCVSHEGSNATQKKRRTERTSMWRIRESCR